MAPLVKRPLQSGMSITKLMTTISLLLGAAGSFATGMYVSSVMPGGTYTLYRNSALPVNGAAFRIHVATFDAYEGKAEGYNRENCDIARNLFQEQLGVTVRYWCEKGHYLK